jgi:hypothetical protein
MDISRLKVYPTLLLIRQQPFFLAAAPVAISMEM